VAEAAAQAAEAQRLKEAVGMAQEEAAAEKQAKVCPSVRPAAIAWLVYRHDTTRSSTQHLPSIQAALEAAQAAVAAQLSQAQAEAAALASRLAGAEAGKAAAAEEMRALQAAHAEAAARLAQLEAEAA
jgi:hypothetical protein